MFNFGRIVGFFLLLWIATPSRPLASSAVPEQTAAIRLARALSLRPIMSLSLQNMVPPGVARELALHLAAEDEELWQLLESEVAKFLAETFDGEQLTELIGFFEGVIGQAVVQGERNALSALFQTASPEEIQEMALRTTSGEASIHEVIGTDLREHLKEALDAEQLEEMSTFIESDLGQAWLRASSAMMKRFMADMASEGTFVGKLSSIGCVVGVIAPNIEKAQRTAGITSPSLPPGAVERLRPVMDSIGTFCDCFLGKVVENWGVADLARIHGQPGFQELVQQLVQAGECPMPVPILEDEARQQRTVTEIRSIGTAMMVWLTDQFGRQRTEFEYPITEGRGLWTVREAGAETGSYTSVPPEVLKEILVPDYLPELPLVDGWGNPYEFAINTDFLADRVLSIRSPGRDGIFDGSDYVVQAFDTSEISEDDTRDIIWADGYLLWGSSAESSDE